MFSVGPICQADAVAIASWIYADPYTLYNHAPDRREAVARDMLDPAQCYCVLKDSSGGVVAFACCGRSARVKGGEYSAGCIDIGLGLRPMLTGQGLGRSVVAAVLEWVQRSAPGQRPRVTIAAFNIRAQRVWQDIGLVQTQQFARPSDGTRFVILEQM